ncbi:MAG: CpsB/CapC family capsule biosynthesis tyrosine phosphatase [Desulfuromonadales bacterium]|nr:CpsB/CapC family capsule biosynthesis tyrosine phosphatase [Desulfuromonadales bacterium]
MIDFHCHLLPALDDGACTVDESIAMATRLVDFGFRTVCCTPHYIKGYYDNSRERVREATLMLQADLDQAGIALQLWPGMEYMLDDCFAGYQGELRTLGATRLVLCEAPQNADPEIVAEGLRAVRARHLVPLLAHPERTPILFQALAAGDQLDRPAASPSPHGTLPESRGSGLKSLLNRFLPSSPLPTTTTTVRPDLPLEGVLFHANLGSFAGYYGPDVQRRAYQLLKADAYTALASDLHDAVSAPKILLRDKLGHNPLLARLAAWSGGDFL